MIALALHTIIQNSKPCRSCIHTEIIDFIIVLKYLMSLIKVMQKSLRKYQELFYIPIAASEVCFVLLLQYKAL